MNLFGILTWDECSSDDLDYSIWVTFSLMVTDISNM